MGVHRPGEPLRVGPQIPGKYKVGFERGSGGDYGRSYYDGKSSLELADAITIAKRATKTADGRLGLRPTATAPPSISGGTKQGQTLAATSAHWAHSPTSIETQWMRCYSDSAYCWPITGATAMT